jgi:hypothetical protein
MRTRGRGFCSVLPPAVLRWLEVLESEMVVLASIRRQRGEPIGDREELRGVAIENLLATEQGRALYDAALPDLERLDRPERRRRNWPR